MRVLLVLPSHQPRVGFGRAAHPRLREQRFGLCLVRVALAAAGWAWQAVRGCEVARFVRATAGDVENVVDLLGAGMTADVAAAGVVAECPCFALRPVGWHDSLTRDPRHWAVLAVKRFSRRAADSAAVKCRSI